MARIALADFITGITGSVGGTTYAKNRYGWYRKNKPIPTQEGSAAQQDIRTYMSEAVNNWQTTLTKTQAEAWDHAGSLHERTKMGQKFNYSGFNLYCGCYVLARRCGVAPIAEPTIFAGSPAITDPVIEENAEGKLQIATWDHIEPTVRLIIKATNAVPQTTSYRNSAFKWFEAHSTTSWIDILIDVAYPGSGTKYRVFFEISAFDLRGAVSSKIATLADGTVI